MNDINVLLDNTNDVTCAFVNNIVTSIGNLFCNSAEKCKIKYTVSKKTYCRDNASKPWYNDKCEHKRKEFFVAKNNVHINGNEVNQLALRACSKAYKQQLKKEHRLYFIELNKKIKDLQSTDPKEYWKMINEYDINKLPQDTPDLDKFNDHFVKLNEGDVISDCTEDYLKSCASLNNNNSVLDKPITCDEILNCIKKLKNNKAMGDDLILNEYLKSTSHVL